MQKVFFREGKQLEFRELIDFTGQFINKGIIDTLEETDLNEFYSRFFEETYGVIVKALEGKNYKVVNSRHAILTAYQVKLLEPIEVWYEALERKNALEANQNQEVKEGDIRQFIVERFFPATKELLKRIK